VWKIHDALLHCCSVVKVWHSVPDAVIICGRGHNGGLLIACDNDHSSRQGHNAAVRDPTALCNSRSATIKDYQCQNGHQTDCMIVK
jgi:hypothetical protein